MVNYCLPESNSLLYFRSKTSRKVIVTRTESNRAANGIRSDGGRNPIGRRTESDQTADGIRSDGGRKRREKLTGQAIVKDKLLRAVSGGDTCYINLKGLTLQAR